LRLDQFQYHQSTNYTFYKAIDSKMLGKVDEPTVEPVVLQVEDSNMVLSFTNLTVSNEGKRSCLAHYNPLLVPIKNFLRDYCSADTELLEPFTVFQDTKGYLKTGEMVLVIGTPGSGKSTLLRALSGNLNDTDFLEGSIFVNDRELEKNATEIKNLCSYVSDKDVDHCPELTVRETLEFAAFSCTGPGDVDSLQKVDEIVEMLGLKHVENTVMGNSVLKGVSGGQKRRVTLGEMMFKSHSPFMMLDNITNGLDASTSLTLIKRLRDIASKKNYGMMVSLLQPSSEIVELFDKVLVLADCGEASSGSQQAYFGPLGQLSMHFNKPHDAYLVDAILQECTGALEAPQYNAVFQESEVSKQVDEEVSQSRSMMRYLDHLIDFRSSPFEQFSRVCRRKYLLILRNRMTYARVFIAIAFGLVVGSLFGNTNWDLIGTLGRQGYLFMSMFLVLMLSAAVTLPDQFRQRPVFLKHLNQNFYGVVPYYCATVLMDLPLCILEAFILSAIPYHWVGLQSYGYFFAVLIGLETVGQSFGRAISFFSPTEVQANVLTTVYIFTCGAMSGFMPTYGTIGWWFRWISWVTPASFAYEGAMLNGFYDETLQLISVVSNDSAVSPMNSIAGSSYLHSMYIPRIPWGSIDSIKALDVGILFVFALGLDILGMLFASRNIKWYGNRTRMRRGVIPGQRMAIDNAMSEFKKKKASAEPQAIGDESHHQVHHLVIRNIQYSVKTSGPFSHSGSKSVLLHDVSSAFQKSRMCALIGTSGAGKSTLLDVIAGYKNSGQVSGDILVNGHPICKSSWQRISSYAEQLDVLNPYLSVQENLEFAAHVRLKKDVPRQPQIQNVLETMALEKVASYAVGREANDEGIAKHIRKRLTIGLELLSQPSILLLDEPTTGLDNLSSEMVMQSIRTACTRMELIVIATIHQPSRQVFGYFDDLLLLTGGGVVAYAGPIGNEGEIVADHFRRITPSNVQEAMVADFILDAVEFLGPIAAHEKYLESEACIATTLLVSELVEKHPALLMVDQSLYPSSLTQFKWLVHRHFLTQWRNPSYSLVRIMISLASALFLGFLFFRIGDSDDISTAVAAITAIFYAVFALVISMQAAVVPVVEDRAVFYRETNAGYYHKLNYGLAMVIADLPFHIANAVLFSSIFYFTVGLRSGGEYIIYFYVMYFVLTWIIPSLGQLFAFWTPNAETAAGFAGLSIILSVLLMGFLITFEAMPDFWRWANWVNMFRYPLQGFSVNELGDRYYKVALPSVNISDIVILFPADINPGTDRVATGALALASLCKQAALSGKNFTGSLDNLPTVMLLKCLLDNGCITDPINPVRFPICIGLFCSEEMANATSEIVEIVSCMPFDNVESILCLIRAILPPTWIDAIQAFLEKIYKIVIFVWNIVEQGYVNIPGNVVLWYFGWATVDGFEIIADSKWYYCFFSVCMFLVGIELFKQIGISHISWNKR